MDWACHWVRASDISCLREVENVGALIDWNSFWVKGKKRIS